MAKCSVLPLSHPLSPFDYVIDSKSGTKGLNINIEYETQSVIKLLSKYIKLHAIIIPAYLYGANTLFFKLSEKH